MTNPSPERELVRFPPVPAIVLLLILGAAVSPPATAQSPSCPPPPPLAILFAPSIVGAGSPNRVASMADIAGISYAWTITNGTITSGQGSHLIMFTAGSAGTPIDIAVSLTTAAGCPFGGGFAHITVAPAGQAVLFYSVTPCRLVDTRDPDGP